MKNDDDMNAAAFLVYRSPPSGHYRLSRLTDIAPAIKRDCFIRGVRVIDFAARRIREEQANYPFFAGYSNALVTLVPEPRRHPEPSGQTQDRPP
jgi:hypothetical protein